MKKPDIGPFGVAAVVLTLLIQAAAISPVAAVVAWTTGRLAITIACRRGVPAARPDGLGALVAGTVPVPVAAGLAVAVAAGAVVGGAGPSVAGAGRRRRRTAGGDSAARGTRYAGSAASPATCSARWSRSATTVTLVGLALG